MPTNHNRGSQPSSEALRYHPDLEIVEFPTWLEGPGVDRLLEGMPWCKPVQRVAAVEFDTPVHARIDLANGVVIDVTYLQGTETDSRGHHLVVRTSGGTQYDLGVLDVHSSSRHTTMIGHAITRYEEWDVAIITAAFEEEFTKRIRERLAALADNEPSGFYAWPERVKQDAYTVTVHLSADLGKCSVWLIDTERPRCFGCPHPRLRTAIRALIQAAGVPDIRVC